MNTLVEHDFNAFPQYIIEALRKAKLGRRKYQQTAVSKAINILTGGNNAEITLPPGTGKTLISQIIGCVWLNSINSHSKILTVLPSRPLSAQHFQHITYWAGVAGLCKPLLLSSIFFSKRNLIHGAYLAKSNYWFTLPEIFLNKIGTYITPRFLNEIDLVIIDEYDAFSIGVLRDFGYSHEFSKDLNNLMDLFDFSRQRFLLLSATPISTK